MQQTSRNMIQEQVMESPNKTEEKKTINKSASIGYLSTLDVHSKVKQSRPTSHVEFHEPIVQKTDEKEHHKQLNRFKSGSLITFGKNSAETSPKQESSEDKSPSRFEVKRVPTILIDKSRSIENKVPRQKR